MLVSVLVYGGSRVVGQEGFLAFFGCIGFFQDGFWSHVLICIAQSLDFFLLGSFLV